ncbi:hypothetical protein BGX21_009888 [Mortierella sp. AD011]|nr:hypothetical protein BGX20_009931 [Mortierella sp. AD010]KAF9395469.1 hypothetical protein BGX21_009888 [Mortierella sp. AD011]
MSNYPPGTATEEQPHYQHPPPPVINKAPQPMGGSYMAGANVGTGYPGASSGPPTEFLDPTQPRPNDILPLHPAIIQQRQIAATLPPCPKGGYHELRKRYALGINTGTCLSVMCLPVVCCCVENETVCIKCDEKFDVELPRIM